MIILTHRGLEPSNEDFYPESSYQAFKEHLERGFGLEFDVTFTKDGIAISHDSNLNRITNGTDKRSFNEITLDEVMRIEYGVQKKGRIADFDELINFIKKNNSQLNALHLKGIYQSPEKLKILIEKLKQHKDILDKILIFDLKPETAKIFRQELPELKLALSVSHDYDIKRYNQMVSGTLFSIEQAIEYKKQGLFDYVWLDEWDLTDENNLQKKLYTKEIFNKLRNIRYKIALVTPELHGTSPGLLGGESHPDAKDKETLFKRIKEIISLNPDVICTDYPEESKRLIN